jgi:outer membrane protein assembly factor BamB
MRLTIALISILLFSGCSVLNSRPHRLSVEKKWVRSTLEKEYLGGRRIHRFEPILVDNLIIAANSIDGVAAYDRGNGHLRWRLNIKDGVEGGAQYADGLLYFGASDGQFYAIHPDSGRVLWTYPLKAEGLAKPLIHAGVVYVLGGNNVAHALNAKTGKLLWLYNRREASNLSVRGGAQPALAGDKLLMGFSDGSLVALNKSSGALIWETNLNENLRFKDVDASPVVDGNRVYVSSYDGSLYALDVADGHVVWNVEDGGYSPVLLRGNFLFYTSSSGHTMALDKHTGKVLWKRTNAEGIGTSPRLYKGILMVGEMNGTMQFIDARTGELLTTFAPGRGVTSPAAVDRNDGDIYFMSADANLFALRVAWKRFSKDWPWETDF